ncbi:glycosyltransferase family 2 protein [Paenibacillus rhizolycopersici]|uniref:glycosyltransferase family 2 protein n=1 Tax=Paenibacillus rhizolycopersici TaxID=2780073 RepID=UPI003D29EF00
MKKKVSFLSPTFNSEAWIVRMLDSIPKEDAHEIVICDDGSTDKTLTLLKNYQKHCPKLRILENRKNAGAGHAYNRCLDEATGDYVAIIDSDDYYLPAIREVLAQVDGRYDIYYYNMVTRLGKILEKKSTDDPYRKSGQFKIIRRSFIGDSRFGTQGPVPGDVHFHKLLIDKKPACKYTGIVAYWYNYPREGSETHIYRNRKK